ncbi:uncharacterized protein LOC6650223 [Drosophila willistoni]|uniref:uncharacterized protein LOC6650223 n=1 Tax=Drosophila willistoni TaxID=7260 RepID=UPI001F0857A3|nr:uncharacterized protein LOC6650223 [Drosophila willistoni]
MAIISVLIYVCLWLAAAKLEANSKEHETGATKVENNFADYSAQNEALAQKVDAENNQLQELQLLVRPAEQVKVTNEVESAIEMTQLTMQQQHQKQSNDVSKTGTQNATAMHHSAAYTTLMSPYTLPISERHNFGNPIRLMDNSNDNKDDDNDNEENDVDDDEQLLRLQNYNLLYNAERQTYFQLHTSNHPHSNPPPSGSEHQNQLNPSAVQHHRLLQHVVGNTLTAAFGLNLMDNASKDIMLMTTENIKLYDSNSLRHSRFNPFNPTRIIIHGWLGNAHANIYNTLLPAYMNLSTGNYNVFTVDWGRGAIADYITASYRVKPVGQVVAKFVDFLHQEAGMRFEDLQLIGFSMGAHVAGLAGKYVQTGRLKVIRALDPALPFFRYAQEKERLTMDDADYVEVLHTSVGSYGFDRPLGHVDFYANWGSQQPGCFWHECSHWRAFILFGESLQLPLFEQIEGKGCVTSEWQQLTKSRHCAQETDNMLSMAGDLMELSMDQLARRRGVYYFQTNDMPPYMARIVNKKERGT